MVLGFLEKIRSPKKKIRKIILKKRIGAIWINPIEAQRVKIDDKELIVKKVLNVTPDEIVVEDHTGTIRVIKRKRQEPAFEIKEQSMMQNPKETGQAQNK